MTPFEKLQSALGFSPLKPNIAHLQVYSCRAYPLKYNLPHSQKLKPRAHIRYLVRYQSTNIYRVYIPNKKKVIQIKDVTFNKQLLYDNSQLNLRNLLHKRADQILDIINVLYNNSTL